MKRLALIIPTLNEERFLPQLLTSLTKQTRQDFDIIVVDGSSKDRTVEIAQAFRAQLPTLQVIVGNKGVSRQRNLGAATALADWLVFVDADSVLLPYCVERLEWFIENQRPTLFTTWFRPDCEDSGDALFTLLSNMFVEGGLHFNRPIAPGPLTAVKREVFNLAGGYDESLSFGEDYDLTTRIIARGFPLKIFRETLYVFSLRRIRRDGKLRFSMLYAWATLRVLLINRNYKSIPSYVTGGHIYDDIHDKHSEQPLNQDSIALRQIDH